DGRRGGVEPQPVQQLRAGRAGLRRRRAAVRPPRPGAAAEVGFPAGTGRGAGRCAMRRLFALARRSRGGGPLPTDERPSNPASSFFSARRSRSESHWVPAFAGMTAVIFSLLAGIASAQDLLIRNATVHTATARGTLQGADVLVKDGRIAAVGSGLQAGGATVVDAQGQDR